MKEPNMVGAVARCRQGKTGVICSIELEQKNETKRVIYKGVSLNGTAWQSIDPIILAPCINEYIRMITEKQILEEVRA